jgi:hypothetical protein
MAATRNYVPATEGTRSRRSGAESRMRRCRESVGANRRPRIMNRRNKPAAAAVEAVPVIWPVNHVPGREERISKRASEETVSRQP